MNETTILYFTTCVLSRQHTKVGNNRLGKLSLNQSTTHQKTIPAKDRAQHCCGIQTLEYVAATAPTLLDYTDWQGHQ